MTQWLHRTAILASFLVVLSLLSGCTFFTGPDTSAKAIEITIIDGFCQRFTPITDTSSVQTRRFNRGRYALCEPQETTK